MTVSVPAQYQGYVTQAAKALGIPEQVVAAQIDLESTWNPTAVSPAGAQGIAQFEPGTWAQYGHGSPFNVDDAFAAYTAYMSALLHQEGGDIRKALQAYNAGPKNLGAGSGYADTILRRAGGAVPVSASGGSGGAGTGSGDSGGGLLSWPADITGFFTSATDVLTGNVSWMKAFFQPSTYVRLGAGLFGTVFLILAVVFLAKETKGT